MGCRLPSTENPRVSPTSSPPIQQDVRIPMLQTSRSVSFPTTLLGQSATLVLARLSGAPNRHQKQQKHCCPIPNPQSSRVCMMQAESPFLCTQVPFILNRSPTSILRTGFDSSNKDPKTTAYYSLFQFQRYVRVCVLRGDASPSTVSP